MAARFDGEKVVASATNGLDFSANKEGESANTKRWIIDGLTLVHRLRRWPNVSPSMAQRLLLTGADQSNVMSEWWWKSTRINVHGGDVYDNKVRRQCY